jgi:hypothetical protein
MGGMDGREWYDESGWHYEPPTIDPCANKLTLALLKDLSNPLIVHGYAPLRGGWLRTDHASLGAPATFRLSSLEYPRRVNDAGDL